ncbi:hypothetical protein HZS_7095 [Henneguya salminicola]|nr:hypothetical protein HZS_7095 [Henneguya salminicola]
MVDREGLEKKIKTRPTITELYSKGIIQRIYWLTLNSAIKVDPKITQSIKKFHNANLHSTVHQKIQARPNRQDLVERGILNDQECQATMIKKCISDHLVSRPGPLDVYYHLVSTNGTETKCPKENLSPYLRAKTLLMCKSGEYSGKFGFNGVHAAKSIRNNRRNNSKVKNITFHEFVPGKSGSHGYFVRSDWERTRHTPNRFTCYDHYRQLIEQQALFLKMELSERNNKSDQNIFNSHDSNLIHQMNYQYSDDNSTASFPLGSSPIPEAPKYTGDFTNSLSFDFLSCDSNMLNDFHKPDYFVNSLFSNPSEFSFLSFNTDHHEDFSSSGYCTSMLASDSSPIDANHNVGFGLFNDCDTFNSVYDKIELYERLQESQNYLN